MDNLFQQDVAVSHSILNFLFAGYQGEFAATTSAMELGSSEATPEKLQNLQTTLMKIHGWVQGLFAGDCLFSATWTSPQTFEARKAMEYLSNLRDSLLRTAEQMKVALTDGAFATSPEHVRVIISGVVRSRYSIYFFMKGNSDALRARNRLEDVKLLEPTLAQAQEAVQRANIFTAEYKRRAATLPPEFYRDLVTESFSIPGAFRALAHDSNQLMAQFSGGEQFIIQTFTPDEQAGWQKVGIAPRDAGYWRAYEFSPLEALTWGQSGMTSASVADTWRYFGFNPANASEWIAENILPAVARRWVNAGLTAPEASSYLKRGLFDPAKLPQGN